MTDRLVNEDIDFAKRLDRLLEGDWEGAHEIADGILLEALHASGMHRTVQAWIRANKRVGFRNS